MTIWKSFGRSIRWPGRMLAVVVLLAAFGGPVFAQAVNAGEMRGTVTDPSGAVVPGVSVSILNTQTGVKTEVVTNGAGIYDALSVRPGDYTLTFTKEGFNKLVRQGIDLGIQVLSVNVQLTVGATSQTIEVSAQASLLRTESGEQGGTLQSQTFTELPHVGQTWTNLTGTLAGVVNTGGDVVINGSQRYEGNYMADGGNVVLPRSNNTDSLSLFEAIDQVEIITANFNAQYGSGQAVFNQILKSGTNQFHGSLYEYDQNDFFNARSFFQPQVGRTRWNQYGGSVGGPVRRDKLFGFFTYDSNISRSGGIGYTFYPTADMRKGDFSYPGFMNSDGTPRLIYDPNSLSNGVRTPYSGNKIPESTLDPLAKKLQAYWPMPNQPVPGTLDARYQPLPNQPGVIANNYLYSRRSVSHPYTFMFKVDYNVTSSNRVNFSLSRNMSKSPSELMNNEMWPIGQSDGVFSGLTSQLTDVWTVSPTVVNEARISLIRQVIGIHPATLNKGIIKTLGINYAVGDAFPSVNIGGPVGGIGMGAGTSAVMGEAGWSYTDTLTWIRGKHILKMGGSYERNSDNGGDWGDIVPFSYDFGPNFTTRAPFDSYSGLGYADFLTGQVNDYSAKLSPVVGIRMRAAQFFVNDDFKVRPNLTVSVGVRYEIQGGWTEKGNRLASFDPSIKNSDGTLGAMWYAGNNGRRALQKTVYNTVLPRISLAWNVRPKWAVRSAFGMFSNRWGADVYGVAAVRSPTAFYITGSDMQTDNLAPIFVLSNPNPTLKIFVPSSATRTPQLLNGQSVVYYPYETPASKKYEWNFGIQRELPQNMLAEIAYVGSLGRHLYYTRDLNQIPESKLGQGAAAKPYQNYQSIGGNYFDGYSNYNGLQVSLRKRFSKGLSLDTNYTWSKNLNDVDSGGWADTNRGGNRLYQRAYAPDINYGLSSDDVPHMYKMNGVYELPVGKGKTLLTNGGPLDLFIGGWQISGVFIKTSGGTYMPLVGTADNSGKLYGGSWYPNRIGSGAVSNPNIEKWFNYNDFAIPASNTLGNCGRNVLRGPGRTTFDYAMAKNFSFAKLREGMRLQLRMDLTNALNHPVFSNPNAGIGNSNVGTIRGTNVGGRVLQLGAKLSF